MRKPIYLHPQKQVKIWIDEKNGDQLVLTQLDEFDVKHEITISPLYTEMFMSLCELALAQTGA